MHILLASNTQWVMFSTMMLGIAAGVVGTLAYWKKQSLMSDALAHAALPGIVIAFMLFRQKELIVLLIGAAASALIGAWVIQAVRRSSRIKEDTAMGIVLSVFFGFGIMLLTIVNRTAGGNQSGLDKFIFGQAASMVQKDVNMMMILAAIVVLIVIVFFKEWKLFLFDASFAKGLGLSIRGMNVLYTGLLVLTIVTGIQAVGVILMAALLIIPAVSARYWTQSFLWMVVLSGAFGGAAGVLGTIVSLFGKGWPTGPFIVVVSSVWFVISFVFGTQKGMLTQYFQHRKQKRQVMMQSANQHNQHRPFGGVAK